MSLPLPAPECSIYYPELDNSPGIIINPKRKSLKGFTLIELSIVLVIIGLIIGGILVGRDLINAATVRSQIAQIEKYNQANNTFRGKYGYLPGDLPTAAATQFGFTVGASCNGIQGARDGNGQIEGWNGGVLQVQGQGETELYWQDLSTSKLIDGTFPNGGLAAPSCNGGSTPIMSATSIGGYLPAAKFGYGNEVYVYAVNGVNWFAISNITATTGPGAITSSGTIPVSYAYNMDKKIDDGVATTGKMQAVFINGYSVIVNANNASPDTATTCYNSATGAYSITQNNGNGLNCGVSMQFQ